MNIIIPLCGKGHRFISSGYNDPKPLIKIFDKCMIEYVLDNLTISKDDNVCIIYNSNLDKYNFTQLIYNKYSFINLIKANDTKGATETIFIGIKYIFDNLKNYSNKCLIIDCDTFYTQDIRNIFDNSDQNIVFYSKNYDIDPIFSYIEINDESKIINIKEKIKISDNANTGAYAFTDINILYNNCKLILNNNITVNNECYTSCVIDLMIKSEIKFIGYELNNDYVFSLGTPESVKKYIDRTYAFMFDLDGTLVITDDIYYDVWLEILSNFNIVLTKEIFKIYIQGNNDKYVLNYLLKNIELGVDELSKQKDKLFLENLNKIKNINGIYDIFQQIKLLGHKLCIVTNCNKIVADEIVKYINIDKYVDFIISNNDCKNGKPNSEPYYKAIDKYNMSNDKCIIFEDSKTGILSAKGIYPKLLIGITTIYSKNELENYGTNLSIDNYNNLNIINLLSNNEEHNIIYNLKKIIKKNILDIKKIYLDTNKLKGGFIADVLSLQITNNNDTIDYLIFKYENNEENNLSIMAKKLQLYQREYYFYTNISSFINIKIPKFYNLILNDNNVPIGMILENLFNKNFKINLNLNLESIDITLKIIDRMAQMHCKFWNKDLNKLFPNLKKSNDNIFCPFFKNFINDKYQNFKNRWFKILNNKQKIICDQIYQDFNKIQENLSKGNNLTFIHGDIKSPNIFYDIINNYEPYFIDWQHCAIGKGVQDLIFFIIESFDIINIKSIFNLCKEYYYKKIIEYGVNNYSSEEYENDIKDAISYIPFFTSIWFGTTPTDELIDKNFPYFFISKLFNLIDLLY